MKLTDHDLYLNLSSTDMNILQIRFKEGMEPGTASYNATFDNVTDTLGARAVNVRDDQNPHANLAMGSNKME